MNGYILETIMQELLIRDESRTIPGSGSTKKEEDVVGFSTVSQCKYTENSENINIQYKDLERLHNNASLQGKYPLFFCQNQKSTYLILDINYNRTLISRILYVIFSFHGLERCKSFLNKVKDLLTLNKLSKEVKRITRLYDGIEQEFRNDIKTIENKSKTISDNLLMYNLFDGNK